MTLITIIIIVSHCREHNLAIVLELIRCIIQCVSTVLHRRKHNLTILLELHQMHKLCCEMALDDGA